MFRTNVRSKDGCPDDVPTEIAPGQEVIRGGVLTPLNDPPGNAKEDPEVEGDSQPIQARHSRLGAGRSEQGRIGIHIGGGWWWSVWLGSLRRLKPKLGLMRWGTERRLCANRAHHSASSNAKPIPCDPGGWNGGLN